VRDLIESETPDETTRAVLGKLKRNERKKISDNISSTPHDSTNRMITKPARSARLFLRNGKTRFVVLRQNARSRARLPKMGGYSHG